MKKSLGRKSYQIMVLTINHPKRTETLMVRDFTGKKESSGLMNLYPQLIGKTLRDTGVAGCINDECGLA